VVSLAARREAALILEHNYGVSERRACKVLSLARSSKRRLPGNDDAELSKRLYELSHAYPRYGYRKIWKLLKDDGWHVSRERIRLMRRREGLQVRLKPKKRHRRGRSTGFPCEAQYANHVWSYDFVHDRTADARGLRCLTVIDEFTREGLAIEVARTLTSGDVLRVVDALFEIYGRPEFIRSDNGPELVSKHLTDWLRESANVGTLFIDPDCPW